MFSSFVLAQLEQLDILITARKLAEGALENEFFDPNKLKEIPCISQHGKRKIYSTATKHPHR